MMKYPYKLFFAICLSFCMLLSSKQVMATPSAPPESTKTHQSLAVLNMTLSKEVSPDQGLLISERLRVLFQKTGFFQVAETAVMKEIYRKRPLAPGKGCDTVCALGYGRQLGVKWVLTGSVSMSENRYRIRVKLLNVTTGKIFKEELHDCECPLGGVLERISRNFSDQF